MTKKLNIGRIVDRLTSGIDVETLIVKAAPSLIAMLAKHPMAAQMLPPGMDPSALAAELLQPQAADSGSSQRAEIVEAGAFRFSRDWGKGRIKPQQVHRAVEYIMDHADDEFADTAELVLACIYTAIGLSEVIPHQESQNLPANQQQKG